MQFKNTKAKGECAEAEVMAAFLHLGFSVLKPFGDNLRYDLVIADGNKFFRIQVKTGRIKNNCIIAKAHSGNGTKKAPKVSYKNDIDWFAVYSFDFDEIYIVSPHDVMGESICLRIQKAKNGQRSGVKYAKDYRLNSKSLGSSS